MAKTAKSGRSQTKAFMAGGLFSKSQSRVIALLAVLMFFPMCSYEKDSSGEDLALCEKNFSAFLENILFKINSDCIEDKRCYFEKALDYIEFSCLSHEDLRKFCFISFEDCAEVSVCFAKEWYALKQPLSGKISSGRKRRRRGGGGGSGSGGGGPATDNPPSDNPPSDQDCSQSGIDRLSSENTAKQNKISDLQAENGEKQAEINSLSAQIDRLLQDRGRPAPYLRTNAFATMLKKQRSKLQDEIDENNEKIRDLRDQIRENNC